MTSRIAMDRGDDGDTTVGSDPEHILINRSAVETVTGNKNKEGDSGESNGFMQRLKNQYALRRNVAHHLIDLALFLANVSQLKTLADLGYGHPNYAFLMTFIIFSLLLQITLAILILLIWSSKEVAKYKEGDKLPIAKRFHLEISLRKAEFLDRICVLVVLAILILNMFITGFGLRPSAAN